jgi:hypothetical protein
MLDRRPWLQIRQVQEFRATRRRGSAYHCGMPAPESDPQVIELGPARDDPRIGRARKWLIGISIVFLVTGLLFFAQRRAQYERWVEREEAELAELSEQDRDALSTRDGKMTWGESKAAARFEVYYVLFANVGLAIVYIGLYFWARRNAFKATIVALLLFVAIIVGDAMLDPSTLTNGVIVRALFIAALVKAIAAGYQERKLQAHMPRAKLA